MNIDAVLVRNVDARILTPDEINVMSKRQLYDYVVEAGSKKLNDELQFHTGDAEIILMTNNEAVFQNAALKVAEERACAPAIVNVKLAETMYGAHVLEHGENPMPSANHANHETVKVSQWLPSGDSGACGVRHR